MNIEINIEHGNQQCSSLSAHLMRNMILSSRVVISITHLAHIIFSGLYNLRNGKNGGCKGENGTFKIYVVDSYAGNISRWKIIFQNIVLYKFRELL